MPVIDYGFRVTSISPGTRDILIIPPGWDYTTTGETVKLGQNITVTGNNSDQISTGTTIEPRLTSGGVELWYPITGTYSAQQREIAVIISPPNAAGNYLAGDTVTAKRIPRFPVCHRASRGWSRSKGFAYRPVGAYAALNKGARDDILKLFQLNASIPSENQQSPWAGPPANPLSDISYIVNLKLIGFWVNGETPAQYDNTEAWRIYAPLANTWTGGNKPALMCPDFCIDADIPVFGTVRVVWVDGCPQLMKSTGLAAPVTGAYQTNTQRSRNDLLIYGDAGLYDVGSTVIGVNRASDNGFSRSLANLFSSQSYFASNSNYAAIRPSQIPAIRIRANISGSSGVITVISCKAELRRIRVSGGDVIISTTFPSCIVYAGSGSTLGLYLAYIDFTIPPFTDAARGDRPGMYYVKSTAVFASGSAVTDHVFLNMGPTIGGARYWHAYPDVKTDATNSLSPWPFDVPKLAFAPDDSSTRYVGNAGWLLPDHSWPTYSVSQPTLNKVGNLITMIDGAITPTDSTELMPPTVFSRHLRLWDPEKNLGGSTVGFPPTAQVTLAGTGAFLQGEGRQINTTSSDHMTQIAGSERMTMKVNANLP